MNFQRKLLFCQAFSLHLEISSMIRETTEMKRRTIWSILNLAACSELRFGQILTAVVAKFYQNPIFKSSFAIVIRLENYVPCGATS